jgi:aspartate/methionine/tyrosine aminotransferase
VDYQRMPIEIESPEELGYGSIRYNLAESSVTDAIWDDLELDLRGLVLQYGDHLGHPGLRSKLAIEAGLEANDVMLTVGAASALFILHTTLLKSGDHLIVTFPNYGTNLETPRALGCEVTKLELRIETGWKLDLEQLAALVRPNTKLISLTTPHNPTGTCLSAADLTRVLEIAATVGAHVLVDETYRDMTFGKPTTHGSSLSSKVISVSSLSKSYGLPGIRVGWLMTSDARLMQRFLAAKEQIFICGSSLDEEVAFQVMQRQTPRLEAVKAMLETNLSVLREWMQSEPRLEWIEPSGGCVCFPRITASINLETFYQSLLETHGTYVGPGHWFGMPDSYFRLGFGWATLEQMRAGLQGIARALDDAAV